MEEWRWIVGYKNIYQVSSFGSIRSVDRVSCDGRPLRGIQIKLSLIMGYPYFNATKNGKSFPLYVHHAVARAFIGERPKGFQINHIDGVKINNAVENLEYVSPSDNMKHAISHGLNVVPRPDNRGENHPSSKLTEKDVREIIEMISRGERAQDIAPMYGISTTTIYDIKFGRTWNCVSKEKK